MMMVLVDVESEYRRHVAALVHYATVLVGPDDAMDVVNDAVASSLAGGSLESVDNVRAYWFRSVTNTAAGWHRSRARRRAREVRAAARSRREMPEMVEPSPAQRALRELSMQQRAAVYLTYWADWEPARIAEVLGVSDGTVRKALARGRERLREVLEHDELT
jgi:RNA polymerase sigma-70 factor (ECF subfamily)